jgi:tRNA dimethylallyltransferase
MVALVGPTGVGKTALAVSIAPSLDVEIISVDSMQVYRGMDIGTSKPTPLERSQVPFHMLDVVDPVTDFSVAQFKRLADDALADILGRRKLPMLVGGSGLYYRAVVDDLDFYNVGVADDAEARLEDLCVISDAELHQLLRDLDSGAADAIPPSNRRRVLKAIEVARSGDRLISDRQASWNEFRSPYDLIVVGMEMPRHLLYRRIEERVDAMMAAGLMEEVERLRGLGLREGTTAAEALGYKQLLACLDGKVSLEKAVAEIKARTRNFSKRQLTWFRKDPRVKWFEVQAGAGDFTNDMAGAMTEAAGRVLEYLQHKLEN